MDELEMRKAEVEALRGYYQKSKQALSELEEVLRQIKVSPCLSDRQVNAINELLGERK